MKSAYSIQNKVFLSNTVWHRELIELLGFLDEKHVYQLIADLGHAANMTRQDLQSIGMKECKNTILHCHLKILETDLENPGPDDCRSTQDMLCYHIYRLVYSHLKEPFCRHIGQQLSPVKEVQDLIVDKLLLPDIISPETLEMLEKDEHPVSVYDGLLTLHSLVYANKYPSLPFVISVKWVNPVIGGAFPSLGNHWSCILLRAGIPYQCLAKFIVRCSAMSVLPEAETYTHHRVTSPDFEQHLDDTLCKLSNNDRLLIAMNFSAAGYYEGFQYCLDKGWHTCTAISSVKFMQTIIDRDACDKSLVMVAKTMKTIDIWDEKGLRILHYIFARDATEDETYNLMNALWVSRKCSIFPDARDKISLVTWCNKHGKPNLAKVLLKETEGSVYPKFLENLFVTHTKAETKDYTIYYVDTKKLKVNYQNTDIIGIRKIGDSKVSDLRLEMFSMFLEESNIRYHDEILKGNCLMVETQSLKEYDERLRQKKAADKALRKANRPKVKVQEMESVAVAAISEVGDRSRKVEIVEEKPAPKLTKAEIDKNYVKCNSLLCERLHDRWTPSRVYDPLNNSKRQLLSLSEYKYRSLQILGCAYSEELVCRVFAWERYNPKAASAYERSKCGGLYAEFKDRNVEEVRAAAVEFIDDNPREKLVEVVKRPAVMLAKKKDRLISLNLQSAKHEFLFMRGLFSWKQQLEKPLPIHDEIFEDCLRLGAVRFYNSLLLYARECANGSLSDFAEKITFDDLDAARLRNVLAHNFLCLEDIRTNVESVIFHLGERIVDVCNGVKIALPLISLRSSRLFKLEVRHLDNVSDGSWCREGILQRLHRIKSYVEMIQSKQTIDKHSEILRALNGNWDKLSEELKIWIHHARAIESCILQIGELSRGANKFLSPAVQKFVVLCREVRHIGYHVNVVSDKEADNPDDWNYDPVSVEFLADLIEGARQLSI